MKVRFQFWEQIEVKRGHIRRIWGMKKDSLRICIQSQQPWQLATYEHAQRPAKAEHLKSIFLSSVLQFPGASASILLHNHLLCDLVQDNQS